MNLLAFHLELSMVYIYFLSLSPVDLDSFVLYSPMANRSHFVSLQASGPGLPAISAERSAGALCTHKDKPINTPTLGNLHYLFSIPPKDWGTGLREEVEGMQEEMKEISGNVEFNYHQLSKPSSQR